jgi:hypothetical protein
MALLTLTEAREHLKLPALVPDPGDADLQRKLEAAEAHVLDYLRRSAVGAALVATWLDEIAPVPPPAYVLHAILVQFGEFWRQRGDDDARDAPWRVTGEELNPYVVSLLRRLGDVVAG